MDSFILHFVAVLTQVLGESIHNFDSPARTRVLLIVSLCSGIIGFVVGRISARWSLRRR